MEEKRLALWMNVRRLLRKEHSLLSGHEELAKMIPALDRAIAMLRLHASEMQPGKSPQAIKADAIDQTLRVAQITALYALHHGDTALLHKVRKSRSGLETCGRMETLRRLREMLVAALAVSGDLGIYGLAETDIHEAFEAVDAYDPELTVLGVERGSASQCVAAYRDLLREGYSILARIEQLVGGLNIPHPQFVSSFRSIRHARPAAPAATQAA